MNNRTKPLTSHPSLERRRSSQMNSSIFKGTVSPDIGFYLKVYKIQSVLFVGPLMVFTFFLFCRSWDIYNYIFKLLLWKYFLILKILTESRCRLPPSLIGQYFKGRFLIGCLGILQLSESFYRKALSQAGYWNKFHYCINYFSAHRQLSETRC